MILLKNGETIQTEDGATTNSIIVILDSYSDLVELDKKLAENNLSEVEIDGRKYENMILKDPNFILNKMENGKIKCIFGIRQKTEEEINKNAIQLSLEYLTDEQALTVSVLYPEWVSGKEMKAGYRCRYNDMLYKCLMDHKSQEDWTPDVAVSLWAKLLIDDNDGTIPEWEQPDSTNPYAKGNKVKHNGKTWVSDYDNNVWEPGIFGWSEVE